MSAIEDALRQIDQQREKHPSATDLLQPAFISPGMDGVYGAKQISRKPKRILVTFMVVVLASLLIAVGWFNFLPSSVQTTLKNALVSEAVSLPAASAALVAASSAKAPAEVIAKNPAFQPDAADAPALLPVANALPPRADWLVQASQAWDSGATDNAARLWLDGLQRNTPSTLALQIADFQTLEQAQRLHQSWTREWPVVILAQASPAGPRWMVLALPNPSQIDAVQQQLAQTLGHSIAWASVMQWVATAGVGQMTNTALVALAAPAPAATPTPTPTATAPPIQREPRESKAEKPKAAVSPPATLPTLDAVVVTAVAATATTKLPILQPVMQAQPSVEPPQLNRTNGTTLSDQASAELASKAIDVDFSRVEQWLSRDEFDKALASVDQLEAYIGTNWRTRYLAGVALSGLRRWKEAVVALRIAHQKKPDHTRVALYLSVALQETGDHVGAIDVLRRVTAIHSDTPELWLNQGHSLQALGRTGEATGAYQRFLDLSTTRSDLSQQRSWVSKRLQKDH